MKIKMDEISIKIKLSKKENLKATAIIDFGDFTIKGFRLSVSKFENSNINGEKFYLQPPGFFAGGWVETVWFKDKKYWKEIERKVFEKFKDIRSESGDEDENLWV